MSRNLTSFPSLPISHHNPTYFTGVGKATFTFIITFPLPFQVFANLEVGTPIAGSLLPGEVPVPVDIKQPFPVTVQVLEPQLEGHAPGANALKVSVVALSVTCEPVTKGAEK